jgi:bifunctional enzyme CysN/CysC
MHGALDTLAPAVATPAARATSLLRFFTCGSVDDGKSTLIGRMLYDTNSVFEDQLEALEKDSKKFGTQGDSLDFALLLDGLSAEREQGITIDVAYRYFSSKSRAFIVADTPGHEQYTRNMATGASTAELAIILIDARKGILPQTRRHSYIVSMLGVRDIVLAVNKMDLVDFSRETYNRIVADYRAAVAHLGFTSIVCIPMSARDGDNITTRSARAPWYDGPTLLAHLETVNPAAADRADAAFAMPVQWVNRPNLDFRGYAGTIAAGVVRRGEEITVLPGARRSTVSRIVTADGDLDEARAGQAITLTLADEIDISRGDVLAATSHGLMPRRSLTARVLWMIEEPLSAGRDYIIQHATTTANARVATLHHAIDIESFAEKPADALAMNQIGLVSLACDKPLIVTRERGDRELGAFILIDRLTNQTAALGVIDLDAAAALDVAAPVVIPPPPTLGERIRAMAGEPHTPQRDDFTRDTALGGVGALGLVFVAVVDFIARPILRALVKRREPDSRDINESGAGI